MSGSSSDLQFLSRGRQALRALDRLLARGCPRESDRLIQGFRRRRRGRCRPVRAHAGDSHDVSPACRWHADSMARSRHYREPGCCRSEPCGEDCPNHFPALTFVVQECCRSAATAIRDHHSPNDVFSGRCRLLIADPSKRRPCLILAVLITTDGKDFPIRGLLARNASLAFGSLERPPPR